MNFKTPFKVLTTAALIGTLSLSAVAPGAASAASTVNKVSTKAEADQPTTKIEKIIITKDNKDYTIDRVLYNQLLDANDASVKDATITAVVAADGTYYTREAYSQALAATDSVQEAFVALEEIAKTNPAVLVETIPGSIEIGEGGVEVKDPTETPDSDFKVTEIAAINPTTVKVNFSKAAEALAKADVTVTNDAGTKQLVKSVTLSEDKKSATVVFYDALKAGDYKVAVKDAEETTFKYSVGDVAKVEAETTQTFAKNASNKKVAYKILDESGQDITSTVNNVKFESTNAIVDEDGNVATSAVGSAFVYAVAEKADGTEVKSSRITVKVEESKAVEISDYTVGTKAFSDADYEQVTKVSLGDTATLKVQTKDQFGTKSTSSSATFESLDLSTAVVDEQTGAITPLKEGKFAVKIKDGDLTKTVELEVVAASEVKTISVDKDEVTLSNHSTGEEVKVSIKDQFEKELSAETFTAVATTNAGKALVNVVDNNDGTITVSPKSGEAGTATIEVKSVTDSEVKTTFTVKVTKAGEVDGYQVKGFEAKLDKYADNTDKTPDSLTLSTIPVDANSVQAGAAVTPTYEVKELDANGKELTSSTKADAVKNALDADNDIKDTELATLVTGKYVVTVKVGTVTVAKETLTIVDTAPTPELEFTKSEITDANLNKNFFDDVAAKLKATLDDKDYTTADLTNNLTVNNITFISSNSNVVDSAEEATTIAVKDEGSATLLIGKVNVEVEGKEYTIDMNNFKLTVKAQYTKVSDDLIAAAVEAIGDVELASDKDLADDNSTLVTTAVEEQLTDAAISDVTVTVAKDSTVAAGNKYKVTISAEKVADYPGTDVVKTITVSLAQ